MRKAWLKKDNNGKFGGIKLTEKQIIAAVIGIVGMLVVILVINQLGNKPKTYEELEPLMNEALIFDAKATELSGAYEGIENQLGEDVYFSTIEQGYEDSVAAQERKINEVKAQNEAVRQAGGIASYEDLQRVKIPVQDQTIAQTIEDQFETVK